MDYQLAFSPGLGVTPEDFVNTWNNEADARTVAQVRLESAANRSYNDPFMDVVWLVVSSVGTGLVTNALYDMIKNVLAKKEPKKRIKITKLDQPDGTHLLVIEEEQ